MNGADAANTAFGEWIVPRKGRPLQQTPEFSSSIRVYDFGQHPLDMLGTLNVKSYLSTYHYFIRVENNPYFMLAETAKKRYLDEWVARISLISQPIVNILLSFSKLEENWSPYGAEKISLPTILSAVSFFTQVINIHPNAPVPFVAPMPDGSIHFEWGTCASELRHIIPKEENVCHIYKIVDRGTGELRQITKAASGLDEMLRVFSRWLEGNY